MCAEGKSTFDTMEAGTDHMKNELCDRATRHQNDRRWFRMLIGLDQLDDVELKRIVAACQCPRNSQLLFDSANFDPASRSWCALAVGLDVPSFVARNELSVRNNLDGRAALREVGRSVHESFVVNPLSGTKGEAFTVERQDDLLCASIGLLALRTSRSSSGRSENLGGSTDVLALPEALTDSGALIVQDCLIKGGSCAS
jgi:hypothetical protein